MEFVTFATPSLMRSARSSLASKSFYAPPPNEPAFSPFRLFLDKFFNGKHRGGQIGINRKVFCIGLLAPCTSTRTSPAARS
jgi:hypothetical protein